MGEHFGTYEEGEAYALQVLASPSQTGLEIQEKFDKKTCPEFTLQIFTDGTTMIRPPATYDYPYRKDGNIGHGTGGMGSFTMQDGKLPFLTEADYNEVMDLMGQVLANYKERGIRYKGVLYPTFLKTPKGLKICEINARGGDPELINILDLLEDDVDYGEVLRQIALGELAEDSIRYKKLASAMVYLVSPAYSYDTEPIIYDFKLNTDIIQAHDCRIRFAAAERTGDKQYRTVGSSRTIGLSALGDTPWDARTKIHDAITVGFHHPLPLEYRQQVAQKAYIQNLALA